MNLCSFFFSSFLSLSLSLFASEYSPTSSGTKMAISGLLLLRHFLPGVKMIFENRDWLDKVEITIIPVKNSAYLAVIQERFNGDLNVIFVIHERIKLMLDPAKEFFEYSLISDIMV